MKDIRKAPKWYKFFFGIDTVGRYSAYNYPKAYYESAWGIICSAFRDFMWALPIFTCILLTLYLLKAIENCSIITVFTPIIIKMIINIAIDIINYIVEKKKRKLEEFIMEEECKLRAEKRAENIFKDAEEET